MLENDFKVINCEESSINKLINNKRAWVFKDEPTHEIAVKNIPNISLTAGITSEASIAYSMHNLNNNS